MQHALITGHQRHALGCRSTLPYCAVCFVPSQHTHTETHMLLMDCSLTLSPSSPNPSIACSGNSASGRVAFILYIVLSSTSAQYPCCTSFFYWESENKCQIRREQNQPLPSTDVLAAMTRHQAAFLYLVPNQIWLISALSVGT